MIFTLIAIDGHRREFDVPDGWSVVHDEPLVAGDKCWNTEEEIWVDIPELLIPNNVCRVRHYVCVIRKLPVDWKVNPDWTVNPWQPWSEIDHQGDLEPPIWLWSSKNFPGSEPYPLGGHYRVLWKVWHDTKWVFTRQGVTHYMTIPQPPG